MKISNKEKNLLLYLLAIVIVAGAYFLVVKPCNEKAELLKVSNSTLQVTADRLNELDNNKESYKEEMKDFITENDVIMNKFSPTLKFEDYLLLIKDLEDNHDVFMTRGTISPSVIESIEYPKIEGVDTNVVAPQSVEIVLTDKDGNEVTYSNPVGIFLVNREFQLEFISTYSDMKTFLTYILENEDIMEFESISLTYDEATGELNGNALINTFSLVGNGKEYSAPVIEGVGTGVRNLFGTYTPAATTVTE